MGSKYYQKLKNKRLVKAQVRRQQRIADGYTFGPNFKFIEELPLDELRENPAFSKHHRLRVFANKGLQCEYCPAEGTKFVLAQDYNGGKHYDIYTADNQLMTVDHVLSRAKGGSEDLDNLVPCCTSCNSLKGRTVDMEGLVEYREQLAVAAAAGNNSSIESLP